MSEMIDRSKVLQRLCAACYNMGSFACISCVIPEIIKGIPAIEAKPVRRWISCDDRLPDIDKDVIVYYSFWKDNPIQIAHLQSDFLFWETSDGEFNFPAIGVTHWMPLPEPPEKE